MNEERKRVLSVYTIGRERKVSNEIKTEKERMEEEEREVVCVCVRQREREKRDERKIKRE